MDIKHFLKKLEQCKSNFIWNVSDYFVGINHPVEKKKTSGSRETVIKQDPPPICSFCPVTAVALAETNVRWAVWNYRKAAKVIGLPIEVADQIVASSDHNKWHKGYSAQLRGLMLSMLDKKLSQELGQEHV